MSDVHVPYCTCGHAAQIHGDLRDPDGRRNAGPCTANQCVCDNYHPRPVS